MGSLMASEHMLDRRVLSAPSIGGFLTQVSRIHDRSERIAKLDDYVYGLQAEINKIEFFKRELPICTSIVNDGTNVFTFFLMVILTEELEQYKKPKAVPVLKEFIPLKRRHDEKDEKNEIGVENDVNSSDKMNWMSDLHLCNPIDQNIDQNYHRNYVPSDNNQTLKLEKMKGVEKEMNPMNGISWCFKGLNNSPMMMVGKEDGDELNGLTPLDLWIKNPGVELDSGGFSFKSSCSRSWSSSATDHQTNLQARQKPQHMTRKQRRCWSPELHRRFIDALKQLGGAQAATPKQIRELMRVDGLSNDEVKSHLQKYRLHNRKVSTSYPSTDLLALGASWMSKEQHTESSKPGHSNSGSPQGHLKATGGHSMDHDDYEDDDEKPESPIWKNEIQLCGRDGP